MTNQKEAFVAFAKAEQIQILTGENASKLEQLSEILNVKISIVPDGLNLKGLPSDVDLAEDFLKQIQEVLVKNKMLNHEDFRRAVKILAGDRKAKLSDVLSNEVKIKGKEYGFFPKTPKQKEYIEAIEQHDLVFGVGPAGTGKTYLAMAMAVNHYLQKKIKRIVLSRPAVEAGERLGFLPGDLEEKVNPYLRPLYDALYELIGFDEGNELIEKGVIEVAPLAFMRGRTLSNAFVILDEAQNTSSGQMKMFLTRLGPGSKCLITGDISQIDLPKEENSGLLDALSILKNVPGIAMIYLSEKDVIRHQLVADIIKAYDETRA